MRSAKKIQDAVADAKNEEKEQQPTLAEVAKKEFKKPNFSSFSMK